VKLTKASVERLNLPQGKSEVIVFDEALPGFGIRMRAGGKRTWIAQYRVGVKQRRLTLGTVETLDPDDARKRAKDALARVQLGQDPQAEKTAARAPKVHELTLSDAVERYLTYAARKLKTSTYSGIVLHLRKHWKPLHAQELRNLERRHVAAELGRIAKNSGPYGANRSRAALSALFAWAIGEGLTDANPVAGTNKATDEIARDRVLSSNELSMVWQQAGEGSYAAIVRLLILTGQRREEVGGMRWSEIDLKAAQWRIGAERTKNGLAHDVPLSAAAVAILRAVVRRDKRDLVFGIGDGPFQGWSNAKSTLDARVLRWLQSRDTSAQLSPWRIHDIRRTVATRLADLGVLPHVIEAILNHVSGHKAGVAGVYNRASYAIDKRRALDLWAQHISTNVSGSPSNVAILTKRAG
jgi:integrase